jgi:hypothetical protein
VIEFTFGELTGTTSALGITSILPSRNTDAEGVERARKLSIFFSALNS